MSRSRPRPRRAPPGSPDLHLPVSPAQQLQHAPVTPPRTVARRVHPRSRPTVRVRHEPLGRLTRIGDVAPRHARAADVQLADHTRRNRLAPPVQDVRPRPRQRAADRDRAVLALEVFRRPAEVGAVDRRLGQAVGVDHPAAGSHQPAEPPVQTSAQGVRADGQKPDAAQVFALPLEVGRQGVGEGRDELEALDAFATDEIGQRTRVEQDRTGASDERSAGGQGADPVAGEDVEGEAGGLEVSERRPAEVVGVAPRRRRRRGGCGERP